MGKLRSSDATSKTVLLGDVVLTNSLIFAPIVGLVLAAATGMFIRTRRERDDKQARDVFKIS
jgi:phosphate/sulfate permease